MCGGDGDIVWWVDLQFILAYDQDMFGFTLEKGACLFSGSRDYSYDKTITDNKHKLYYDCVCVCATHTPKMTLD